MGQTLKEAIQGISFYSDDLLYCFVKLPSKAITATAGVIAEAGTPFMAMLVDKDEISLMIEEEDFDEFKYRLLNHEVSQTRYRLITLDIVLDSNLTGFMATIAGALGDADISVMPFAAFSRDHLFVPAQDYDKAIETLQALKARF